MRTSFIAAPILASIIAATACTHVDDGSDESLSGVESVESTASVQQALSAPAIFSGVEKASGAIEKLYSGMRSISCLQGNAGNCPPSEGQQLAAGIVKDLQSYIASRRGNDLLAASDALFVDTQRVYGDPAMYQTNAEDNLVRDAQALYSRYVTELNRLVPTIDADVQEAYDLAVSFNVTAALIDNIGRTALTGKRVDMTMEWINSKRAQTLSTNYALVGAQSLWRQCPGSSAPTSVTTTSSFDNRFATKKLWKLFADEPVKQPFWMSSCSNDCNTFRAVTNAQICRQSCTGVCTSVCGTYSNETAHAYRSSTIYAKMNRDPVVRVIRSAMDQLTSLAPTHGTGVLFRLPSGELDLSFLNQPSYKALPLGKLDPNIWSVAGSGDFSGDGMGDILWMDRANSRLSLWTLGEGGAVAQTAPTTNLPVGATPFIGDLDADGVSDIVWTFQQYVSIPVPPGRIDIYGTDRWLMSPGSTTPRSRTIITSQSDKLEGLGDFARTVSDPDLTRRSAVEYLFRAPATGAVTVESGTGSRVMLGTVSSNWSVKGIAPFNGVSTDILWYDAQSGTLALWAVRGHQLAANVTVGNVDPSLGWAPQGFADVDHDGISDVVWRHSGGVVNVWKMNQWGSVREGFADPIAIHSGKTFAGTVDLGPRAPFNPPAPDMPDYSCGVAGKLRYPGFASYEHWWSGSFYGSYATYLADVSGDGKADLVGIGNGYVGVIRSNGNGFGSYEEWLPQTFWGNSGGTLIGDVTGDGLADLVALTEPDVFVRPAVFDSPRFGDSRSFWRGSKGIAGNRGNFASDVTGDGKADIVAVSDGSISILRSTGAAFGAKESWWTGSLNSSRGLFVADVSGDGKADVVALSSAEVTVLISSGSGFIRAQHWYGPFYGTYSTHLADVNGDGRADLIAGDEGRVRVLKSLGDRFGTPEAWWGTTFNGNRATIAGDLDGNGRADLLAAGDGYVGAIRSQ